MNVRSLKLAGATASTLLLTFVSTAANAQIDAFVGGDLGGNDVSSAIYTFSSPMILNSIGFVTADYSANTSPFGVFEYAIGNGTFVNVPNNSVSLAPAIDGVRWYDLASPITMNTNDFVTVRTSGTYKDSDGIIAGNYQGVKYFNSLDPAANVTYTFRNSSGSLFSNIDLTMDGSNSNIRVSPSNPGSNVAPEPGSFALALTGGTALIGVCIRRRRNAA
jgi:hypothetical protein